jgi:hypothetical protein
MRLQRPLKSFSMSSRQKTGHGKRRKKKSCKKKKHRTKTKRLKRTQRKKPKEDDQMLTHQEGLASARHSQQLSSSLTSQLGSPCRAEGDGWSVRLVDVCSWSKREELLMLRHLVQVVGFVSKLSRRNVRLSCLMMLPSGDAGEQLLTDASQGVNV